MKVLIVNASDNIGGAARSAFRLHKSLIGSGIESQMLVITKVTDDYTVFDSESKTRNFFSTLLPTFDQLLVKAYKHRTKTLFSTAWFPFTGILQKIRQIRPDIVHLHWICGGMLSIEDIAAINVPIVWSLHDNWAFTGGCHIMWECERYTKSCGRCPRLGSQQDIDLSRLIYLRKKSTYSKIRNLTVIGLSRWITDCAKKSSLLGGNTILNLPNLIDTDVFSPIDKATAKKLLGLPADKRLVAFGAIKAIADINKGYKELFDTLVLIGDKNVEVVVFGCSQPKNVPEIPFNINYVGHLTDDLSLRVLYNAVDVIVVPSLQENLSNVIMESLACGTPVAAFDVGGNSDMIDHLINGYLAKPFNSADLARGIDWILNSAEYSTLASNAREKVVCKFDSKTVVKSYIALYQSILNKHVCIKKPDA